MTRGKETELTRKVLRDSIRALGGWLYKIPDDTSGKTGKRPFDCVACFEGRFIAIEVKHENRYKAFGIDSKDPFSDHQIENLQFVQAAGGIALAALIVRAYGQNRLYLWHIDELQALGRNYTKKELMDDVPFLLPVKGVYDITPWLRR